MLLNVRLPAEDERVVKDLQRQGVKISAVVRAALRAEAALRKRNRADDPVEAVKSAIARHPAPKGRAESRPALDDARAVRRFIQDRLARRRR
ncbi:MAG: hypothetical protein JNK82_14340 [Myxococcaceae bacterium]|nr:hypothetical protein [Myxococcaceae bacterium]